MQDIDIINRTSRIRDARFAAILPALQHQITHDFAPLWGADARLHLIGKRRTPNAAHWKVWLLNNSTEPGVLGFHDDDTGQPEAKVFVEEDLRYGAEISVTISHELVEMLADPLATLVSQPIGGIEFALEVGDPVEADSDGYLIGGVRVSDFVLPAYFGIPNPDGSSKFDQCGLLKSMCPAMRPGGYLLWFDGTWHSTMARYEDGTLSQRAIKSQGRSTRRANKTVQIGA